MIGTTFSLGVVQPFKRMAKVAVNTVGQNVKLFTFDGAPTLATKGCTV
jgi:hypothetical protein